MIEVEINGSRRVVDPPSTIALREEIERALPDGHVMCSVRVNGRAIDTEQLDSFEVASVRSVAIESSTPDQIARSSLSETHEWLGRVINELQSVAEEYRVGRTNEASGRLVEVVDALQVAAGLLGGIHRFLEVDASTRAAIDGAWASAESDLLGAIEGLFEDLDAGDSVRIADRTGHELPRALGEFRKILTGANA